MLLFPRNFDERAQRSIDAGYQYFDVAVYGTTDEVLNLIRTKFETKNVKVSNGTGVIIERITKVSADIVIGFLLETNCHVDILFHDGSDEYIRGTG